VTDTLIDQPLSRRDAVDNQRVGDLWLIDRMAAMRAPDGGFGPVPDAPSEPEATAMAALALNDDRARAWLSANQRTDGGFGIEVGTVLRDDTALAALALPVGDERERALDRLEEVAAARSVSSWQVPHREDVLGWPWTDGTFGWTEPTAWGVLALRRYRPGSARINDGIGMLRDRECVDGGWNFGNRVAFDVNLRPYVQTTAVALLALAGAAPDLTRRGLSILRTTWRSEAVGLLSVASAAAAFRRFDSPEALPAITATHELAHVTPTDAVALAWAILATGPELQTLRVE
jgi:hypothetical protein